MGRSCGVSPDRQVVPLSTAGCLGWSGTRTPAESGQHLRSTANECPSSAGPVAADRRFTPGVAPPRPVTGTATASGPRLQAMASAPRCMHDPALRPRRSRPPGGRATGRRGRVRSRRSAMRSRYSASRRACSPSSISSQFSFDRWKVSGSCGSGISSASQPCSANSALRPSRGGRGDSGSGCEVKNWNGVDDRPLLAHEKHCGDRAIQRQRRLDRELARSQVRRRTVADRRGCRPGRGCWCRPAAG